MIALTKTLDPADLDVLQAEVERVKDSTALEGQHEMRVWEYAMALRAYARWWSTPEADPALLDQSRLWYDIGGAGCGFADLVRNEADFEVVVIDPLENTAVEDFHGEKAAVVTVISVLEHVDEVPGFVLACVNLLRPGGLLFLTMDYHDAGDAGDPYHFHWMRQRIFGPHSVGELVGHFIKRGLQPFGATDLTWHGPQVYDYSFVCLALVKNVGNPS